MRVTKAIAVGLTGAAVFVSACGGSTAPTTAPRATTTTRAPAPSPATSATTSTTDPVLNPRLHVSLLLPTPTLVSGTRVDATLVIQNDTGAPMLSGSCLPPGESVLGEIGLSTFPPPPLALPTTTTVSPNVSTSSTFPYVGEGGCRGPTHTIAAVGTTRVAFKLEASSSLCQLAPAAQLQVYVCLPGGVPLPPGKYYISWVWYGRLPTPTITVPVVAASK